MTYLCAGINHPAFFLEYAGDGEDAYPRIREAFDTVHKDEELFRQELFRRLGYFMTESSFHLSEYLPYFIKSPRKAFTVDQSRPIGPTGRGACLLAKPSTGDYFAYPGITNRPRIQLASTSQEET